MAHFFAQKTFSIILASFGGLLLLTAFLLGRTGAKAKNQLKKHIAIFFLIIGIFLLFHGIIHTISTYSINILLDVFFIAATLGFYFFYGFPLLLGTKRTSEGRSESGAEINKSLIISRLLSIMLFVFSGITLLTLLLELAVPQTQEFTGVTQNIVWVQNENTYTAHSDQTHSVSISLVPQEVCTKALSYYKSQRGYFTNLGFTSRLIEAETKEPHRLVQWLQSFTEHIKENLESAKDSYTASVYFLETDGIRSTLDFYYVTVFLDKEKNVASISIAEDSMLRNHIKTAVLTDVSKENCGLEF